LPLNSKGLKSKHSLERLGVYCKTSDLNSRQAYSNAQLVVWNAEYKTWQDVTNTSQYYKQYFYHGTMSSKRHHKFNSLNSTTANHSFNNSSCSEGHRITSICNTY